MKQLTGAYQFPGDEAENECGHIKIEEPDHLYIGRNVTITFHPKQNNTGHKPKLLNSHTTKFEYKCFHDCNTEPFTFVLIECQENLSSKDFYVNCGCRSGFVRLRLKALQECGDSYIRRCNPEIGQVEFVYIPATAVVGFKAGSGYVLYWLEYDKDSGVERRVDIAADDYEQRNESNWTYVLVINVVNNKAGHKYGVQCTDRPPSRGSTKYTDAVTLDTRTPQSPVLGQIMDIDDCRGCLLIGNTSKNSKEIFCKTKWGTNLRITMKINGYTYPTAREGNETYTNIYTYTIGEIDHLTSVVCSVTSCATKEPLIASATLYLAVEPDDPKLVVPVIYKGTVPNITCLSKGGRPKSSLKFYLNSVALPSTQTDQYDSSTRTYNSIATITAIANKSWDKGEIRCFRTQLHTFSEKASRPLKVKCIYPPSEVLISFDESSLTRPSDVYRINVTCKSSETNAQCDMTWKPSSDSSIYLQPPRKHSSSSYVKYSAVINGSLHLHSVTITCTVSCDHFEPVAASELINIPHPPKVQINTSSLTIVEEGALHEVTCDAESYPFPNITWSYMQDGREHIDSCHGAITCSVLVSGLQNGEQRKYVCTVEHIFQTFNTSFVAEGRAQKSKITQDENGSSLVVGAVVGSCLLLAGVTVVAILFYRKRRQNKLRTSRQDKMQRSHDIQASNDADKPVEYAVVSRTSKITTAAHASPSVASAHVNPSMEYAVVSRNTTTVSMAVENAVVSKTSPNLPSADARQTAPPVKNVNHGQLVYAELDTEVLGSRPAEARSQHEEAVEYVDIDFSKKANVQAEDNIYASQ